MDGQRCLVFVALVSVMVRNISSQQCGVDTYSIYQMMLKGHTYKMFKARPNSMDCRMACNSDVSCQSYNNVFNGDICELNNRTKEARPADFIKDRDRYYITKAPKRVPLGSILELPAYSCGEIKASEGQQAVSGKYWLDPTRTGNSILVDCYMDTGVPFHCLPSWIGFEGSCYRLFKEGKSWNNASVSCKANGAQLVKIESAEENNFIKNEFLASDAHYWIGLTDAETENVWKWSDGSTLEGYNNWKPGQPNNYNNDDCGAIGKGKVGRKYYDGEWNDGQCPNSKGYVCEM